VPDRVKIPDVSREGAVHDVAWEAVSLLLWELVALVVVVARVSRSGSATPQPGDLQGATAPVANNASGVSVVIDSVVR